MNDERWTIVDRLFDAALEREPHERAAFLREACPEDEGLRREVESLLTHERAAGFLSTPAAALADEVMSHGTSVIGQQFGPYVIHARLGAGGMGEVYRARDTTLGRDVAIKILRRLFTTDPERRARFDREARLLASLNHPNIGAIYGLEEIDGVPALVLELVEGSTLAERIERARLTIDEAFTVAIQIADAVQAAHERGIIHRDLKPANVILQHDGPGTSIGGTSPLSAAQSQSADSSVRTPREVRVKVVDFGLAKLIASPDLAEPSTSFSVRSHGSSDVRWPSAANAGTTQDGRIVGSPAYMSPEQAEGRPVDTRSDVWAFGCVLYEMLTGTQAFTGHDISETIAAVVHHDVDWHRIPPDTPASVRELLGRCLEPDRDRRLADIGTARFELTEARRRRTDGAPRIEPGSRRRRNRLAWSAATLSVVVAVVLVAWAGRYRATRGAPPLVVGTSRQLTADEGLEMEPAISPDGRFVAYSAGTARKLRIFIRALSGDRAIPLSDDKSASQFQPRWSPDGSQLLYVTPDGAFVVPASGGAPRRVGVSPEAGAFSHVAMSPSGISGAAWAPDGRHIAIASGSSLSVTQIDGGVERPLGRSQYELHSCDWSPDGVWIACASGNWNVGAPAGYFGNIAPSAIVLIPAAGGDVVEITDRTVVHGSPVWSADGQRLYFVSNRQGTNDVYSVEVADDGHVRGIPIRITTGLGAGSITFSADRTRLAYSAAFSRANIWSVPIPSEGVVSASAAVPVTTGTQIVESMRVSRDRKWLLYDSNLHGNADIYRVPIGGGQVERLTTDPGDDFGPDLSADGRWLAYHSWRTGSRDVFVQSLDGAPVQQVTATPSHESYPTWSPDGTAILFYDQFIETPQASPRGAYLVRRDASGRWGAPVALPAGAGGRASWSSDGRFLAYSRWEPGAPAKGMVEIFSLDSGVRRVVYMPRSERGDPLAELIMFSDNEKTFYFKSHDEQGRASIWSMPVIGGRPSLLVRFDDLARPSARPDLAAGAGHFYFAIEDRQSDIWIADVTER